MVITLGQQYNVGEKPTVILYTYINRHAGTPTKGKTVPAVKTICWDSSGVATMWTIQANNGFNQVRSQGYPRCLKKNLNASKPSEHPPQVVSPKMIVVGLMFARETFPASSVKVPTLSWYEGRQGLAKRLGLSWRLSNHPSRDFWRPRSWWEKHLESPCSERILLQTSNNGHGSPSPLYYRVITNIKWSRVTFAPLLPVKPPHHHATKLPPTHAISVQNTLFPVLPLLASLSLITDPISCTVLMGPNINVRFFPYYAVTDCTHWHWHE